MTTSVCSRNLRYARRGADAGAMPPVAMTSTAGVPARPPAPTAGRRLMEAASHSSGTSHAVGLGSCPPHLWELWLRHGRSRVVEDHPTCHDCPGIVLKGGDVTMMVK